MRADLVNASWIKPVGGLVKDQQVRVFEQRRRDSEALFHAERVLAELVAAAACQPNLVQHGRNPPLWRANCPGQQSQVLLPRECREELRLLNDGAHPVDDPIKGQRHLMIKNPDVARVSVDQSQQHPDRRCLARSVGSQEPVDAADGHPEVQAVDRRLFAVAGPIDLLQAVRLDGVVDRRRPDDSPPARCNTRPRWIRQRQLQAWGEQSRARIPRRVIGCIPQRPSNAAAGDGAPAPPH